MERTEEQLEAARQYTANEIVFKVAERVTGSNLDQLEIRAAAYQRTAEAYTSAGSEVSFANDEELLELMNQLIDVASQEIVEAIWRTVKMLRI